MQTEVGDERPLIAAAQAGDHHAFRALYDLHVDTVFRYAAARVGRHEAEDVCAEVFCRAWTNLARYEDRGGSLVAWLLRIARNLMISKSRRTWPRLYDNTVRATAPDGSFEDQVVTALLSETMADALACLDERHRMVLTRRFLEEQPVAEVAGAMALSEEGVRALTYRALKSFRHHHAALCATGDGEG